MWTYNWTYKIDVQFEVFKLWTYNWTYNFSYVHVQWTYNWTLYI